MNTEKKKESREIDGPHDIATFYAIAAKECGQQEAAKAASEIADLIAQFEPWLSIDSAPRDGSDLQLWCGEWTLGFYGPMAKKWFNCYGLEIFPTHWMPLPAGPK